MTLKFKTNYTVTSEKEIELPAFYKDNTFTFTKRFVAILDDDTMVTVNHAERYSSVRNESTENLDKEIAFIDSTYELTTEEEFFKVYNEAMKSLQLMPIRKQYYADGTINATI